MANIKAETGLNPWTATQREVRLKLNEQEVEVPHTDLWRLPYLQKLLAQRHDIEVNCRKTIEINKIVRCDFIVTLFSSGRHDHYHIITQLVAN